jgi:hypothetical protein
MIAILDRAPVNAGNIGTIAMRQHMRHKLHVSAGIGAAGQFLIQNFDSLEQLLDFRERTRDMPDFQQRMFSHRFRSKDIGLKKGS